MSKSENISKALIRRIQSDIADLEQSKDELNSNGIYWHFDEGDIRKIYVVITGQDETPYANCPFFFEFTAPDSYPMVPWKGKFATGDGRTRFNPNLYVEGKICLSILGTWQGPSWTPIMTIKTVIMSICALVMTEAPLQNEPGWEQACKKDLDDYNQVVEYRSLCVGIVQQFKNTHQSFQPMKHLMVQNFVDNFPKIWKRVQRLKKELHGKTVTPRYGTSWTLDYNQLEGDLQSLAGEYGIKIPTEIAAQIEEKPLERRLKPKPSGCEIGDEYSDGDRHFQIAVNSRGVKYWKKVN